MVGNQQAQSRPDVTIIGAGIIGLCSALELHSRGMSVTVIEKASPGSGTSFGNAGIISPWSCVPQSMPGIWKSVPKFMLHPEGPLRVRFREMHRILPWVAEFFSNTRLHRVREISDAMDMLMRGNMEAYRAHLKGTGFEHLIRDSWFISVYRSDAKPNLDELAWQLRIERGAPIEVITGGELREIEPELSHDFQYAVLQKGQSRTVNPGAICDVLARKARRLGISFHNAEIENIRPIENGSFELDTAEGVLLANKLVLCSGIWTQKFLKSLGIKIPLISERGYHLEFTDPDVELNNSILDVAGKFIISSMEGAVRSAGTSEFADVDAPPNYQRADMLAPMSKRIVPGLNIEQTRRWVGSRPSFPDNLPVIGELPNVRNLFGAFGHSHYGLGMAPATARILADCIVGVPANADRSSVSIDRFAKWNRLI